MMSTEILTSPQNYLLAADHQAIINQDKYELKCIWVKKRVVEVACVALGLFGIAISAYLGIIYIPLAIATVMNFVPKLNTSFYEPLTDQENKVQTQIKDAKGILAKIGPYQNCDEQTIRLKLLDIGVFPVSIEHQEELHGLKNLTPLIAQYDYWVSLIEKTNAVVATKQKEINRVLMFSPLSMQYKLDQIRPLQREIYKIEEEKLLEHKIKAAFILNVISNVFDLRRLQNYGEVFRPGTGDRYIFNQVGHNPAFILNNGTVIERDFILRAKVNEVAKQIFNPKAL